MHAAIQQSIREMNPSVTRAMGGSGTRTQQEKARALFEKYGMKFDASEWQHPGVPSGDRIEKPIRMRVHRTCHRCQTTFGRDKTCTMCGHGRCKTCPRYPVKKPKELRGKGLPSGIAGGVEAGNRKNLDKVTTAQQTQQDKARALFEKYGLKLEPHEWQITATRPSERVEKPIRMRIHRHCHRCQTTFGPDKVCSGCNHTRCKKCPRYPVKKKKQQRAAQAETAAPPEAVTDEAGAKTEEAVTAKTKSRGSPPLTINKNGKELVRRKPRQAVRRTCHLCEALFVRGQKTCEGCKHVRCSLCPRDPPKLHKYPNGYPNDAEPPPELYPLMEREYRKPRVRVRWTCHTCEGIFKEGSKTCAKCNHERCDQCSRWP